MKTKLAHRRRHCDGYALMMVLVVVAATMLIAGATIYRTYTVAKLNDRNNQYLSTLNAAEAATEKVYARMAYDFQSQGVGLVNFNLPTYRTNLPNAMECGDSYWSNFEFTDGQGNVGRTYAAFAYSSSGPLPSKYPKLYTSNSPVYRIISNARLRSGKALMTNAIQVDVLLALVPVTQYAIFYNQLL